jgi:hypothetical protein
MARAERISTVLLTQLMRFGKSGVNRNDFPHWLSPPLHRADEQDRTVASPLLLGQQFHGSIRLN